MITLETPVEEVLEVPGAIAWCIRHRVSLVSCSGAFPASLGRLLELKGVPDPQALVDAMNRELGS
jgi:hypothetical protein